MENPLVIMGRTIRFGYGLAGFWPRISDIWIENDPYGRNIEYNVSPDALLMSAVDAGGRTSTYDYDFRLLFGGEVGMQINVLTILAKIVGGPIAGAVGSMFGQSDIELYGRVTAQIVNPLKEMTAPGQGVTKIYYDQPTIIYGNADMVLFVPVSITLSLNLEQRLLADKVEVYLGETKVKEASYTYDFDYFSAGQSLNKKTTELIGKKKTIYYYEPVHKVRFRWEDKSGETQPNNEESISFLFPVCTWRVDYLTVNNRVENYDSSSNTILDVTEYQYDLRTMRPTKQTIKRGVNYRTLDYRYGKWGKCHLYSGLERKSW